MSTERPDYVLLKGERWRDQGDGTLAFGLDQETLGERPYTVHIKDLKVLEDDSLSPGEKVEVGRLNYGRRTEDGDVVVERKEEHSAEDTVRTATIPQKYYEELMERAE